jgi:hypothetical protein
MSDVPFPQPKTALRNLCCSPPISPLGFSLKCMILRMQRARVLLWPSRCVGVLEHLQTLTWLGGILDASLYWQASLQVSISSAAWWDVELSQSCRWRRRRICTMRWRLSALTTCPTWREWRSTGLSVELCEETLE